jgi:hypothetical protein
MASTDASNKTVVKSTQAFYNGTTMNPHTVHSRKQSFTGLYSILATGSASQPRVNVPVDTRNQRASVMNENTKSYDFSRQNEDELEQASVSETNC